MKPGTDAHDAEKIIRDEIAKVEDGEKKGAIEVEQVCVPMSLVEKGDTSGESAVTPKTPDGKPAGMRGRVVVSLSPMEVYQKKMQALKPCISCKHLWFPQKDTHEWQDRAAHLAFAQRIGAISKECVEAEFGGCTVKKMWVQVNYSCGLHRFRDGWWRRAKEWAARMTGKKA
ncbi:MAG: hypothetical protein WCC69_11775 [Pirellulales bacterium]